MFTYLFYRPRFLVSRFYLGGLVAYSLFAGVIPGFAKDPSEVDSTDVAVELIVRVPNSTPEKATLFVAGNLDALGNWRADGLPLKSSADGSYHLRLSLPRDTSVEFKITHGTWETVEKGPGGEEIANRSFLVSPQPDGKPQRIIAEVASWASLPDGLNHPHGDGPSKPTTITGRVEYHAEFKSAKLDYSRTLTIWLPAGYDDSDQRYRVLYMQDGQNLFDEATAAFGVEWGIDEAATRLIDEDRIHPIIVVGIGNTKDRLSEYTPTADQEFKESKPGGRSADYVEFLVKELKPFIDQSYRTKPEREFTAIGGSSLGGLISLVACEQASETFSACAAISPTLGWDNESWLRHVESEPTEWLNQTRLWIDMGTKEGSEEADRVLHVKRVERLGEILRRLGKNAEKDYQIHIIADGEHNEAAWAERFPDVLQFLFGR